MFLFKKIYHKKKKQERRQESPPPTSVKYGELNASVRQVFSLLFYFTDEV